MTGLLVLAGCDSEPSWHGSGSRAPRDPAPDITVSEPANGATNVPASTEVVFTVRGGEAARVELTGAGGTAVAGAPVGPGTAAGGDAVSWLPAERLQYGTRYTATVTATVRGRTQAETVSFTTMPKPSNVVRVSSVVGDGQVVGVGMPLILTFGKDIDKAQRAAVQRRLFVTADPPQEGAWNWFNGHEVHFRPREYWKPGTRLALRAALGGLPLGGDRFGGNDLTVDASVVPKKLIITVENATKQLTVTQDGQVLKVIPVSLGKPSSPSSSGNMIVMAKNREEWFDSSTYGVPADSPDGYRTKVHFTQRLTWDGQYIHAAPWSVADQGARNVSHGCTNVSTENAEWLYAVTHIGDPVVVTGTGTGLTWGNGYTDWDVDFERYRRGGALPVPSGTGPVPSGASPAASPS